MKLMQKLFFYNYENFISNTIEKRYIKKSVFDIFLFF